jgi:hypothetical protein
MKMKSQKSSYIPVIKYYIWITPKTYLKQFVMVHSSKVELFLLGVSHVVEITLQVVSIGFLR